jgi:hypothetical protein
VHWYVLRTQTVSLVAWFDIFSLPRLLPVTGVGLGGTGTEWLSEEASAEEPVPDALADL